VRRILSISLLLLLTLPLVSPLLAASIADANVPACCRRDGKHHCMMVGMMAARSASDASQTKSATAHGSCPYTLVASVAINLPFVPDEFRAAISASTLSSATDPIPAESARQISLDRSHQKRGPPSLNSSHS
jgi:Protein of unknown function (DUF2946).